MARATAEFKCRRCGFVWQPVTVDVGEALDMLNRAVAEKAQEGPVKLTDIHYCSDDGLGLADLIGFEVDG